MSCMMLSDKHFSVIANAARNAGLWFGGVYGMYLAKALYDANKAAYITRYSDHEGISDGWEDFVYYSTTLEVYSAIDVIRAIQCLDYQCAELGDEWDNSKERAFLFFELIPELISETSEYAKSDTWSIR